MRSRQCNGRLPSAVQAGQSERSRMGASSRPRGGAGSLPLGGPVLPDPPVAGFPFFFTAGRARVGALVHPITDPHSGQPDSKAVPAALAPVCFAANGFVLARARVPLPGDTVFAWTAIEDGYAARFATNEPFASLFETFAA